MGGCLSHLWVLVALTLVGCACRASDHVIVMMLYLESAPRYDFGRGPPLTFALFPVGSTVCQPA